MLKYSILLIILGLCMSCETKKEDKTSSYLSVYENSKGTETATYQETITFYQKLAKDFSEINIQAVGETDSGFPLHVVTFNPDGNFNFEDIRKEKLIILINNGIHPGESDGIDATMLLYRDLAINKLNSPQKTVLVTLPIYNIGGALNRNTSSRANQNGPSEYGFRGNSQNYDLNRDFIKMDTKNAKTFAQIFHEVKPDIFIDNHVSNGADYQYTLTHLFTQHNKLGGSLGYYLHHVFMPKVEESLANKQWDIVPYVNVYNSPPELGFNQFMDHPRYSTGYTTLWNTLGLMIETHMLKPYKKRVEGTYQLIKSAISVVEKDHDSIKIIRQKTLKKISTLSEYYFNWKVDTTKTSTLHFKGYTSDFIKSELTDQLRLKYNQNAPFTKATKYYNYYIPQDTIKIPPAYIIKHGWHDVMDRLDVNNIRYFTIKKDTILSVESYKIRDYETRKKPYEGHYLHFDTKVDKSILNVKFRKGDFVIPTNQPGIRYLMETLEPQGVDSFFNWNFFDTVLQRKEGFSPYVFEDVALELLQKDSVLESQFMRKKISDPDFAQNGYAQLNWIYQRSKYLESSYLSYPVYRLIKEK